MKKALFVFLLFVFVYNGYSQEYRCFDESNRRYFTNGLGYLRGMRIDSVSIYPDSAIYYPFKTCRGDYNTTGFSTILDTAGGSWLGKKVIRYTDGTYFFDNVWNDTVVIKTQASIGDSWDFYTDTSNIYYRAEMVSQGVRMIFGVADTVKTIVIRAFDRDTGLIPSDPVNGYKVSISKHFGFYEVFDLYFFPHRRVSPGPSAILDTSDYFFFKCEQQEFRLTDFYNPPQNELFDLGIGDILEYRKVTDFATGGLSSSVYLDSIIGKTVVSSTVTEYVFVRNGYAASPFTLTVNSERKFDTTLMPEEKGVNSMMYYFPDILTSCNTGNLYRVFSGTIFNEFEPCGQIEEFRMGPGKVYEMNCTASWTLWDYTRKDLVYYTRYGEPCGTYIPIASGIEHLAEQCQHPSIVPNPANETLQITFTSADVRQLEITDMLGASVVRLSCLGKSERINTVDLPAGLYCVRIVDGNGRISLQKISIVH